MFAALESSVALLFTVPLATLEITLPPALIPAVLSIEIPPTVTLSVVIPVPVIAVVPFVKPDVLITVLPAVTESTVIFLAVPMVKVLPVWLIAMLSPLLKVIVSPPFTSSSACVFAFTLKEEAALAASLIACSLTVKVTSLPDAAVEINLLSPLILKDTLPSFKDLAVVDVPLSSANAIVWAMFAVFVAIFVVLVVI